MVKTSDGKVPVLVTRPQSPLSRGLVLIHEAFGINAHVRDLSERFAAEGFLVAAPSLFHRFDRLELPYEDIAAAKTLMSTLTEDNILNDVQAAIDWLRGPGEMRREPVAIIGYCFGGRVSYLAGTHNSDLAAVVSYYGGGIAAENDSHAPVTRTNQFSCPVLAIFGGKDTMIPAAEVGRIERALDDLPFEHHVEVYEQAGHGFFCDARPANYDAGAAKAAWKLTLDFLQRSMAS